MTPLAEPTPDDRDSVTRNAQGERHLQIRQVVDDCQIQRAAGQSLSDAGLVAKHPELMPQLGEQLKRARLIACARARADQEPAPESGSNQGSRFSESNPNSVRLQCPHCQAIVAIPTSGSWSNIICSACGSSFKLVDDEDGAIGLQRGDFVGRFELLKLVGTGGFGVVWKARDPQLDRVVALKIPRRGELTGSEEELFFREARAAAQVRHPNIVSIYEVGRDGDSIYLVSDFVDGESLSRLLESRRLTIREAAALCEQIAQALEHIHTSGTIHRDLKPANVIVTSDAGGRLQPHLTDFGLARRVAGEMTMTVDGQLMGTPAYMSPEQASGDGHAAGPASDVYSLGVILFELLTNEPPFRGAPIMVIDQVLHDEPVSPRKLNGAVPQDLETITLKCLEKNPGKRYQTAGELGDELSRYLRGEAIHARPINSLARAWRWSKRKPVVAGLLALLVAASVFSIWQAILASQAKDLAETRLEGEQVARKQATDAATNATALSNLLQQMLQSANPEKAKGTDYTVRQMLDDFSGRLGNEMKVSPETEAAVRATISNAYTYMGVFDKADDQLTRALKIREQALGPEHPDVAVSLTDLAFYLHERGDLAEAESRVREALSVYRKLGLENRATVRSLFVLQVALVKLRRPSEAAEVGREALRIAQRQLNPPPDMASILHLLADSSYTQGKPVEAEALAREAVTLHRKLHGDDHVETGWGIHILGLILAGQKKDDEADECFREALAIFRKQYGASHGSVGAVLSQRATILREKGDQAGLDALIAEVQALGFGKDEFGLASGMFPVDAARVKHVTCSGWIKTENVDTYASLFCTAVGPKNETLAFADMPDTGPRGTNDWARSAIGIDVPPETCNILFGMKLDGKGRAWFDGVEVTLDAGRFPDGYDLDFEAPEPKGLYIPNHWTYHTELDDQVSKVGKQSLRMESIYGNPRANMTVNEAD